MYSYQLSCHITRKGLLPAAILCHWRSLYSHLIRNGVVRHLKHIELKSKVGCEACKTFKALSCDTLKHVNF